MIPLPIDFTNKNTPITQPKAKKTTKKRNRPLYDSYLPASKNIRITPLPHSVKQCNCICFIHNGENQGHNPTPITEKSVPTTKTNNIQAKNTLKDPSIPSRATNNSQPLPNKSSIAKPTTSVAPVTPLIKPKFTCAEEALYSARNNILEAYSLTSDRDSQKQLLDFLNLFRAHTEKGYNAIQGFIKHNDLAIPVRTPPNPTPTRRLYPYADQVGIAIPPNSADYLSTDLHLSDLEHISRQNIIKGLNPLLSSPFRSTKCTNNGSLPKPSYAQAVQKPTAPSSKPMPPAKASKPPVACHQPKPKHQVQTQLEKDISSKGNKVITLVLTKGASVPTYQATQIRDKVNKAMGKIAISRVHTSPRNNIVLTCFNSTPEELLDKQPKWEKVFADWPISKAQKVETWPNVVIHGVPSSLSLNDIPEEISSFNPQISVQGQPRWLTGPPKTDHGSIVMTVSSEAEKAQVIQSGVLIGGLLLRAVNYKTSNEKTLCSSCLKYGHHQLLCKRKPVCAICMKDHKSSEHSCSKCKASDNCSHHSTQCVNCKSSSHTALQKKDCEYYKALL